MVGYGYKLKGWPVEIPIVNGIDNLSESSLKYLRDHITTGDIYWEKIPVDEL